MILKKTIWILLLAVSASVAGCGQLSKDNASPKNKNLPELFLVVLGIAQDAGFPQAGCEKECCAAYYSGKEEKKLVTCLALVDRATNKYWLIEATPDIATQLKNLQAFLPATDYSPEGIFITHAHIGHYTGLMQLGREAMGVKDIPVYVMPRLDSFIRNNGPWSQLVSLQNISLRSLNADSTVHLNASFKITPVKVPHRDEYSETVGFIIQSDKKKVLFIPDIDKWEKWARDIVAQIGEVDFALLDGTFYKNGELPGRDMSEVPHPFVEESLQKFSALSSVDKSKIIFIHFNHTNPLLKNKSAEKENVIKAGFAVAEEGMIIEL
ncbi:MAG TPA: MBL fold metallo-hydrolase [Chitinophagaceae bacterium]|nr:MBL fold metallo-hydrolase [Chitinophagaceae bacterium]